jgi:hypothetical protein
MSILLIMLAAGPATSGASKAVAPVKTLVAKRINTSGIEAKLIATHGEPARARVEQGVRQAAALWRDEDGDLAAFATAHFIADPARLEAAFVRFEANLEQIDGHLLEIGRELRRPTELDLGPMEKVDPLFAAWDPSAHLTEDFFASKLALPSVFAFTMNPASAAVASGGRSSRSTPSACTVKM